MVELLTSAQMRAIEEAAIASGAVTGLELMERAGQAVVDAVFAEWPRLAEGARRAVILCGPGNNGGDGFVIARLLKQRGWEIDLMLFGDPDRLPPDAKLNHDRWAELGPVSLTEAPGRRADPGGGLREREELKGRPDLYVDAVFGTGLTRPVDTDTAMGRDYLAVLAGGIAGADMYPGSDRVVAVDIPSGLCADSGRVLGGRVAPFASLTVSFHAPKLGHMLAEGPDRCGKLVVADIGLPQRGGAEWSRDRVGCVTRADPLRPDPSLGKDGGHKFDHGHALVLVGPMGRTGAARLAARAALRVGAGLVTLGAPGAAMMECACQLTAIMLRRCGNETDLASLLEDQRINALCLGPGLGLERARDLVPAVLAAARGCVLDADALSAFADAPDALFGRLHARCVLTPHDGEFARLFPDLAARMTGRATEGPAYSRVDAARDAAARAGCTVLLKGPDTVIAAPDGAAKVHAAVYERAAPWLATAGAGDVLAGMIAGLMARGFVPHEAAASAAWLHVAAARAFGPGVIAEDLPEMLPRVFRDLGL